MSTSDIPKEDKTGLPMAGRPRGSKNIHSKRAAKKLAEMGFDPIEKMIELLNEINADIANLLFDEDGEPNKKFSSMAHATLVNAKQKCISDLLRYGYARAAEGPEVNPGAIAPTTILLTATKDDFDKIRSQAERVVSTQDGYGNEDDGDTDYPEDDDAPMKGPNE
jgi:hypothetical protein